MYECMNHKCRNRILENKLVNGHKQNPEAKEVIHVTTVVYSRIGKSVVCPKCKTQTMFY